MPINLGSTIEMFKAIKPESVRGIVFFLIVAVMVVITRNAWLSDDAFITMRTIDNFVHGYGLRYNIVERVQAYTHPLWLGLVSLIYAFTREAFYTLIAISLLCSVGTIVIVTTRIAISRVHAILTLLLLVLSKSFVDFSTSGLENPLTHLLLALFIAIYIHHSASDRKSLFILSLIAGLGLLNRMDTALLFFPPLLYAICLSIKLQDSPKYTLLPLVAGMCPFIIWEMFSLFYYGFLFPNTAYAKLGAGIPHIDLVEQSFYYYADSLVHDPLTLIVIFGGLAMVIFGAIRDRKMSILAIAVSPLLYLAYIVWIGGDFMSGRFFSAVFIIVVALIARHSLSNRSLFVLMAIALCIKFGAAAWPPLETIKSNGVVDERRFYLKLTALSEISSDPHIQSRTPDWSRLKSGKPSEIRFEGAIGMIGFVEGPDTHIVDFLGLADPILARLPTQNLHHWRIGHFERKQPIGYMKTLISGKNHIEDSDAALFYDHLSEVIRGELFSLSRLRTIFFFNVGRYDALINLDYYSRPYGYEVDYEQINQIRFEGFPWDDPANIRMAPRNGVMVRFKGEIHCNVLELGLNGNTKNRWTFYHNEMPMAYSKRNQELISKAIPIVKGAGIRKRHIQIPKIISETGFDALLIFPYHSAHNSNFSLGYVQLCK